MNRLKLGIVGCGYLGNIIIDAYELGLLPDYEIIGVCGRTASKAQAAAERVNEIRSKNNAVCDTGVTSCKVCEDVDELLALKPDYIAEAASVACVKDITERVLTAGCSIVVASIGAFADEAFKTNVETAAREHGTKVYIASGAVGGFDVLRTISLMAEAKGVKAEATFHSRKYPGALANTPLYDEKLMNTAETTNVFDGSATEAIAILPTKVNVAVATALASVGPDQLHVTMDSEIDMRGDDYVIASEIPGVHTSVNIYSSTSEIAAWSIVSVLRNITAPIAF